MRQETINHIFSQHIFTYKGNQENKNRNTEKKNLVICLLLSPDIKQNFVASLSFWRRGEGAIH